MKYKLLEKVYIEDSVYYRYIREADSLDVLIPLIHGETILVKEIKFKVVEDNL